MAIGGQKNITKTVLTIGLAVGLGLLSPLTQMLVRPAFAAQTNYLHAAISSAGSNYSTASPSAPVGTLAEAAAAVDTSTYQPFSLGSSSTWVSDPAPAGTTWTLTGQWSFSIYVRATVSNRYWFRAIVYRVDAGGTATALATADNSNRYDVATTYAGTTNPVTWSYSLGTQVLNPGERWGVRFLALANDPASGSVFFGLDSASQGSSVSIPNAMPPTLTATSTPTPTSTALPATATAIPSAAATSVASPTATSLVTGTVVATTTASATPTASPTGTATPTVTATTTVTPTATATQIDTPTVTPTSTPVGPQTIYLDPTNIVITNTYLWLDANPPSGSTPATIVAAAQQTWLTMGSGAGTTLFVSNAVLAEQPWNIAGIWNMYVYARADTSNRFWFRARFYRIDAAGNSSLITTTGQSARFDVGTTYNANASPYSWSYSMPATVINPGERLGVQFQSLADSGQSGNLYLGYDAAAQNSRLLAPRYGPPPALISTATPTGTATATPGGPGIKEAHYRIGHNSPLENMTWWAPTDTMANGIPLNTNFRVRFQVYNDGPVDVLWRPKLGCSTVAGGPFTVVPVVSSVDPFFVADTQWYANGAAISTTVLSLSAGLGAGVDGRAYDAENPVGSSITLTQNSFTEIEFNVQATSNASYSNNYFFNLTDAGANLTQYAHAAGAEISTETSPAPTPTQVGGLPTPTAQPPAHNGGVPYGADTSACAGCHRPHIAPAKRSLQKAWPEETTCFVCHDGSGAPNIKAQFDKTYKMPITATEGVHSSSEIRTRLPGSFSGASRHVECVDCHNPHYAGGVTHSNGTNYAAGPLQGQWGVSVGNTITWTAPSYGTVYPVVFEYQLCFKCHSSWAYGTSPPVSPSGGFPETNQAMEFNTLNPSYHPVEAPGKNSFSGGNGSYSSSLINGFTPNSTMQCADCHRSETPTEVKGPHGSTAPFILQGRWDRTTGQNTSNNGADTSNHVCFKCHDYNRYTNESNENNASQTGFSERGGKNLHAFHLGKKENNLNNSRPIVCMDCHVAIPHGWRRDHLLGFDSDEAPYINRPGGLRTIDTLATSGNWSFDNCATAMGACK